jgi:hypothetical protein
VLYDIVQCKAAADWSKNKFVCKKVVEVGLRGGGGGQGSNRTGSHFMKQMVHNELHLKVKRERQKNEKERQEKII